MKLLCNWSATREIGGVLVSCPCMKRRGHLGRHRFEGQRAVTIGPISAGTVRDHATGETPQDRRWAVSLTEHLEVTSIEADFGAEVVTAGHLNYRLGHMVAISEITFTAERGEYRIGDRIRVTIANEKPKSSAPDAAATAPGADATSPDPSEAR